MKHRKRFAQDHLRRWAARYGKVVLFQCGFQLSAPWLFALCPNQFSLLYSAAGILMPSLAYIVAQCMLLTVATLRLRFVAADAAAGRAGKLRMLFLVVLSVGLFVAIARIMFIPTIPMTIELGLAALGMLAYTAFHANAFFGVRWAAQEAAQEAELVGHGQAEATRAILIANVLTIAAVSTVWYLFSYTFMEEAPVPLFWSMQFSILVDLPSDVFLAILSSGVLHDDGHAGGSVISNRYKAVGALVQERHARLIREKLLASINATSGPALAVAALLEELPVAELMDRAMLSFRCIHWRILESNAHIITGGGLLQDVGAGGEDFYQLSEPCGLGRCDFFWSHSWSDSGELKWQAVRSWAEARHQRENSWPSMWLDKVCVDQSNIVEDLRCLPVYLAGCNNFLVTSGLTYASRLWCALELFVYFAMTTQDSLRGQGRRPPTVLLLASDDVTMACVRISWLAFDVHSCDCFQASDRRRILDVIDRYPGGSFGFNGYIRGLTGSLFSSTSQSTPGYVMQGVVEDMVCLGSVIHQWSEREWENVIASQATL